MDSARFLEGGTTICKNTPGKILTFAGRWVMQGNGILSALSFPCQPRHLDSGRQRFKPEGKTESGARTESGGDP